MLSFGVVIISFFILSFCGLAFDNHKDIDLNLEKIHFHDASAIVKDKKD
jgi:hypothetical protein